MFNRFDLGVCDLSKFSAQSDIRNFQLTDIPVSSCRATGLEMGESCTVSCKSPWTGGSVTASCPAENQDPNRQPDLSGDPNCDLQCPRPPDGNGYSKNLGGGQLTWHCIQGYSGEAKAVCATNETCHAILTLSGCYPLQNCKNPDMRVIDGCKYNMTECDNTFAGGECRIKCRSPYVQVGVDGQASCSDTNVNVTTPLRWDVVPTCQLTCIDPVPMTPGYERVDAYTLKCAVGYTGTPSVTCPVIGRGEL